MQQLYLQIILLKSRFKHLLYDTNNVGINIFNIKLVKVVFESANDIYSETDRECDFASSVPSELEEVEFAFDRFANCESGG
jgi:hypothetical protein